jgi:hypothetical protein
MALATSRIPSSGTLAGSNCAKRPFTLSIAGTSDSPKPKKFGFLDVFSGMVAPLESLERQGFGPVGPKTQAFNEVEWRVQPFLDPMDPLKTSRKPIFFIKFLEKERTADDLAGTG